MLLTSTDLRGRIGITVDLLNPHLLLLLLLRNLGYLAGLVYLASLLPDPRLLIVNVYVNDVVFMEFSGPSLWDSVFNFFL